MTEVADERETETGADGITRIGHWIDGESRPGEALRCGKVWNPATGRQTGEVAFASVAEVDEAVQAAKRAFGEWRGRGVSRPPPPLFPPPAPPPDPPRGIARGPPPAPHQGAPRA